ncbi:hypothetical protein RBB50_001486 [Rhinocladiella similis]
MLHMKVFHHFETTTRHTLCFKSVWKAALRWSLEHETLMHAMLCISARHLAYLCPNDPMYDLTAGSYLVQTLGMFRRDINDQTLTASNADAFMATSILIYFELWTETDFVVKDLRDRGDVLDLSRDNMAPLARGLIELFLRPGPVLFEDGIDKSEDDRELSIFVAEIKHSPRRALDDAALRLCRLSKDAVVESLRSSLSASLSGSPRS